MGQMLEAHSFYSLRLGQCYSPQILNYIMFAHEGGSGVGGLRRYQMLYLVFFHCTPAPDKTAVKLCVTVKVYERSVVRNQADFVLSGLEKKMNLSL